MTVAGRLVSVVVPTRNSARTLEGCLLSVRAQSYAPIELIVIDNGSTDQTWVIARRVADIVQTWGPERSAQRNRGAHISQGQYLLFIDSDMQLEPGVVSDCVSALDESGYPAVVIPEVSVGMGFLARCRALERSCYSGDDAIEAARFFSRHAFNNSGGFDEDLTGPEDWDLSARVASGRRLPRTNSHISHDEGNLSIRSILEKKRYYAASSLSYWRKHGRSSLMQANLVLRPALLRNWRRLLRHPILALSIFGVKSLETLAATVGTVQGLAAKRRADAPR